MDFDKWRKQYDAMTYIQHTEFYKALYDEFPMQRDFDAPFVVSSMPYDAHYICEVGGGNGGLANIVLRESDINIKTWVNYDIAPQAIAHPVCEDSRYSAIWPTNFVWCIRHDIQYDVLIMSHFVEHIRQSDFAQLMDAIAARAVIITAPLQRHAPTDHTRYLGTHIFEGSWDDVDTILAARGFACVYHGDTNRSYWKI